MARKRAGFVRPHGTTANPLWHMATRPEDLIPTTDDRLGHGAEMVKLTGYVTVTQGAYAGDAFGSHMQAWQDAFVRFVFGEVDAQGNRKVRRALLKMAKGNGKSFLAACIALAYVMWLAKHGLGSRALVLLIGPNKTAAGIIFQHLNEAVRSDEELLPRFHSDTKRNSVTELRSGIEIQVIEGVMANVTGRRPVCVIVDELWLCAIEIKDFSAVLDQARKGMANWGDLALEIALTTSPTSRAVGEYRVQRDYARKVRDGEVVDPSFLPALFEWPVGREAWESIGDHEDPSRWWIAAPSAVPGGTLPLSELERELADAKRKGSGSEVRLFLSQRLGIEPDAGAVAMTVLQQEWPHVEAPATPNPRSEEVVSVGLDPGGTSDPFAVAWTWRQRLSDGTTVPCVRCMQWLVQSAHDEAPDFLKLTYDEAIAAGELRLMPTVAAIDDEVIKAIREIESAAGSVIVGGDRFGRAGFVPRLENELLGPGRFKAVKQGYTLIASYEALESAAHDRRLRVHHTPLLDSNVQNLRLEDGGVQGRRFAKADAGLDGVGHLKIDGAMAMLSALELFYERPEGGIDVDLMIAPPGPNDLTMYGDGVGGPVWHRGFG